MEDIKRLAAITALNEMLRGSHFNVCTLDKIAKMLNIQPPSEPYRILSTLHCVDWSVMPEPLRERIPSLIEQCLSVAPTYQFRSLPHEAVCVDTDPPRTRSLKKLLGIA